jgi:hypothetical protein
MRKIKFISKLRQQGQTSKVITVPLDLAKRLEVGKAYQFEIELINI